MKNPIEDDRQTPVDEAGHPSLELLIRQQGVHPVADIRELMGDFWPEDESIDDFLAALHKWRGHDRSDCAA